MIGPGGRGLNPFQPIEPDDFLPRGRHLRMPAKQIGGENLLGNSLLPGIDDFRVRRGGVNLIQMTLLQGVAEDDAHGMR